MCVCVCVCAVQWPQTESGKSGPTLILVQSMESQQNLVIKNNFCQRKMHRSALSLSLSLSLSIVIMSIIFIISNKEVKIWDIRDVFYVNFVLILQPVCLDIRRRKIFLYKIKTHLFYGKVMPFLGSLSDIQTVFTQ